MLGDTPFFLKENDKENKNLNIRVLLLDVRTFRKPNVGDDKL